MRGSVFHLRPLMSVAPTLNVILRFVDVLNQKKISHMEVQVTEWVNVFLEIALTNICLIRNPNNNPK